MIFNRHTTTLLQTLALCLATVAGFVQANGTVVKAPADFSGHWVIVDISHVQLPEWDKEKYTDTMKEMVENYEKNYDPLIDDPAQICLLKGMPWTMLNRARNYPMEVYQTADRVILFFELYDTARNILIDGPEMPDNRPPSGNGYSTAHWEGKTLVVKTVGMTETNYVGQIHRTEDAIVTERWNLIQDPELGELFQIDITMDDPALFKEPAVAKQLLRRAPEGTVVGGYNCSEDLWAKHVDERNEELGIE